MRRTSWVAVGLLVVLLAPLASADLLTRIELEDAGALGESDLGIKVGAVSPDGMDVLVGGMNGFARLLSADEADNRAQDVELVTGRNSTIQDIAWHPRGNTALLVGDEGMAMRYDTYDHSITYVNGTFSVLGHDLTSVVWRPGGDFAYVASSEGKVWKFAEHTGFELLENTGESRVTDLSCHRNYNVCIMSTVDEGLAVIDEGHALGWLSQTAALTWVGVDCASSVLNECVGFASGLETMVVRINTLDARQSTVEPADPWDLPTGEFVGVSRGDDGTNLIHLAPLGLVRYTPLAGEAFSVLLPEDTAAWDAVIAGRGLAVVWENTRHSGFIITDFGNIIKFSPAVEEVEMNIMDVLVLGAVAVSVPGVILGLIYMNSPWMQRKYRELRFGKK
ncbi:MAG: WD40 repeat domain-containing protein [Candidatus Poseidoniales archaeon]|nr:MAG: WD40 repeat domain-containing protein [Candidatus Poseidoniales archaeon]